MTPRDATRSDALGDVESQLLAIERAGGTGDVDLGRGVSLHVTSLGKTFFAEPELTKGDLLRYYARVWPAIQPVMKDRPLVLKRYPDGSAGPMFFQQNAGAHVPDVVRVETIKTQEEGPKPRIVGGDLVTLLYTVQIGAIEVHPWLSRVGDIDSADRCLIDLDPGDDVPFSAVVALAKDVREIAKQCDLPIAAKTSGSSGIHLVMPLPPRTSYADSARLAMLVARAVAMQRPARATVERSIHARPAGTIYVDAMQNARGKSMASAYSVRAKASATVSAPLRDSELTPKLRTSAFTMRTMPGRLSKLGDVWGDGLSEKVTARTLQHAIRALEQLLDDEPAASEPRRLEKRSRGGGRHVGTSAKRRRAQRT